MTRAELEENTAYLYGEERMTMTDFESDGEQLVLYASG